MRWKKYLMEWYLRQNNIDPNSSEALREQQVLLFYGITWCVLLTCLLALGVFKNFGG